MDEARLSAVAKHDVASGPESFKRRLVERLEAAARTAFGDCCAWAWAKSGVKAGVVKRRGARLVSLLKSEAK